MNMMTKPGWQYWAIAVVGLLWNCVGAMDYTMTAMQVESYVAMMTAEQRAYVDAFPAWSIAFWALGVWGALIGSVLMLLRNKLAVMAFAVSLLGLLGTTIYQYVVSDAPDSFKTPGTMAFSAAIWVIALFLFWYARKKRDEGVLG